MTALPRTLLDLAATVRLAWLEKMVERSEDLGLFDLHAVEELLARTTGHHGHARLRKAIALYQPSSFTRSGLEKRFHELSGLPRPHYVERGFELNCTRRSTAARLTGTAGRRRVPLRRRLWVKLPQTLVPR